MKTVIYDGLRVVPSKVVCIGRNYIEHISELGNEVPSSMVIFNKPNSSITDTFYYFTEDTRFEGEISFMIVGGAIKGVGFGLDLTKADSQNYLKSKGLPWERAKSFDNSAVFGEFVQFGGDLRDISFEMFVNGKLAQSAKYELMIYKPDEILKEIESFMSLEDYDIIMSGTPKGVATYKRGDRVLAYIYYRGEALTVFEKVVK